MVEEEEEEGGGVVGWLVGAVDWSGRSRWVGLVVGRETSHE